MGNCKNCGTWISENYIYCAKCYKTCTYQKDTGYVIDAKTGRGIHRELVEKRIGRKLKPTEEVHHRNKDPRDNRPDNIYGFLGKDGKKVHRILHAQERNDDDLYETDDD